MASDQNYKKINQYFLEQNMGLFLNAHYAHYASNEIIESLLNLNRERLRPFIIHDMPYDYKKNDKYR